MTDLLKQLKEKDNIILNQEKRIKELEERIAMLELQKTMYREKAYRDKLTNLYNRRAAEQAAESNVGYQSLIFADIDNFKSINDTYGHKEGDEILKAVANFLKTNIRESDMPARWGGDEFAILLKDCTKQDAYNKALALIEKLKLSVTNHEIKRPITMSFGISSMQDKLFLVAVQEADIAMYESKQKGKDTATIYTLK